MSKQFSDTEKKLVEIFSEGTGFKFEGKVYFVELIGKPSPAKGECKTDIYILANTHDGESKEFKISVKQGNADFLENKISLKRAIEIFGDKAQDIITDSTIKIKGSFEEENLIFFYKKGKTEAKCVTLGWKFELLNKLSGNKSGNLVLTDAQKLDVYAGTNLSEDKKNCRVNGGVIKESGVANYILVVDDIDKTADYFASNFEPITNYIKEKDIYFACKALNYRVTPDKWDGNRPLAVYVNWTLKDKILKGDLTFNNPLETKGNEVGENIQSILKKLNISEDNFSDLEKYLDKDINHY